MCKLKVKLSLQEIQHQQKFVHISSISESHVKSSDFAQTSITCIQQNQQYGPRKS